MTYIDKFNIVFDYPSDNKIEGGTRELVNLLFQKDLINKKCVISF